MGKLYPIRYAKYPIPDLHVSGELFLTSNQSFTHVNILQQEKVSEGTLSYPFLATVHLLYS